MEYRYVLPAQLADKKGDAETQKLISQAWFHRKSADADGDETGDFTVEIDGCQVHFAVDQKLTGHYRNGALAGKTVCAVSGVCLTLSLQRKATWEKKLQALESDFNGKIREWQPNSIPLQPQPQSFLPSHTGGETVKRMIDGQARQGDVFLQEIKTLPNGLTPKDNVLAHGEVTGHSHRFSGQCQVLADGKTQFVVAEAESVLEHEEHEAVAVPKGLYKVTLQREHDFLRDEVRQVSD